MTSSLTVSAALARSGLVPGEGRILLAHALGCDRAWLAAHGDAVLPAAQAATFEALARRRRHGEPVAYLTGRREFFGLDLEVSPDVLIPRPETELLVEAALERVDRDGVARVLDLGAGSGAVALAIAHQVPRADVLGVDRSAPAVALARRNADRLRIANAHFALGDWFLQLPSTAYSVIVANPPYVADADPHLHEGDLRFEPPSALRGGPDGLGALRTIVAGAPEHLAPRGWLLLEHGYDQSTPVQLLLQRAGFDAIESRRDLAGVFRVTAGRLA